MVIVISLLFMTNDDLFRISIIEFTLGNNSLFMANALRKYHKLLYSLINTYNGGCNLTFWVLAWLSINEKFTVWKSPIALYSGLLKMRLLFKAYKSLNRVWKL